MVKPEYQIELDAIKQVMPNAKNITWVKRADWVAEYLVDGQTVVVTENVLDHYYTAKHALNNLQKWELVTPQSIHSYLLSESEAAPSYNACVTFWHSHDWRAIADLVHPDCDPPKTEVGMLELLLAFTNGFGELIPKILGYSRATETTIKNGGLPMWVFVK